MITTYEACPITPLDCSQNPTTAGSVAALPQKSVDFSVRLLPFGAEKVVMLYLPKTPLAWDVLGGNKVNVLFAGGASLLLRISGHYLMVELKEMEQEATVVAYKFTQPLKRFQEVAWEDHVLWLSAN